MKRYGLIGYPLGHSFSEKYFTEKFLKEGIHDCAYNTFAVPSIEELPGLLVQYPDLAGLNVTIPYKKQVIDYLDSVKYLPEGISACNCIRIIEGKKFGFNTDVTGFEKSLQTLLQPFHKHALVLGNGGAADAVKFVLRKLNIEFKIVSRQLQQGVDLTYDQLDASVVTRHLLIINTTPLGTFPNIEGCPQLPYDFLTAKHYLYDLVYNPEKTVFLQNGERNGAAIKNGYDMLVLQAEESWRIWNSPAYS
ncbi:MAG: shikimate dehydrogenase [Bacteroidetes bacterium]|nr:shikimate dehydrogenase [Bacteroidota bacterium]